MIMNELSFTISTKYRTHVAKTTPATTGISDSQVALELRFLRKMAERMMVKRGVIALTT